MSLQLHILPCTSSDKLKKSFLDQLSLHVELNREASSTVSLPLIVIFRPQGRPNDEFDGVVLPFLDKGDPSCKDVILFTALATTQLYGRGFTTDCTSRFKYMDKLFITSGHLDTQINRSTFTKLGDILVQEYGFKQTSGSHSHGEQDQGSIHLGGNQEEVIKRSGSDLRKQLDKDLSPGGDANIEVGTGYSLGGDANRLENNSARHRLRIINKEMEGMTTDLQKEVENKWKLLVQLPRILEAVLEELYQEPKAAEILERYIEQTCNHCTRDDQVNATGSDANSKGYKGSTTKHDANSRGDKGSGVTTSTSEGGKPLVSVGHQLTHSTRDAPPRGEELLESGHNIRLPSDTGCHQTLNDIDSLRMIQEDFNKMTADLQKYVETNLKVPQGKLLTILEAVLRYQEQERKGKPDVSKKPDVSTWIPGSLKKGWNKLWGKSST
ncbi:uncharacterized protein LOC124127124 [Haliotis rufescens]|uniref:uncharacterized protein LOC124127124 n=1 Tax=Haliotis rufescens TaxID=6454 RepID=UPI00201F54EE|nr:uncharacterized protein LOC124127124 [Haliotis rufescens]XP_048238716.1 uncharacterized protein LOC124127124 [Haliotis rufescens]